MLAVHASWGRFGYPDGLFSEAEHTHGIHGGDIETSIMLAAYPDLVRREKIADFRPATYAMERDYTHLRADFPAGFGWMTQDLHASGAVGDASLATRGKRRGGARPRRARLRRRCSRMWRNSISQASRGRSSRIRMRAGSDATIRGGRMSARRSDRAEASAKTSA